jgi:DNA-binding protein HU-beta
MNRQELIEQIAEATGENKTATELFLDAFINTVQTTVAANGKVMLVGFGSFTLKKIQARVRRNPASGELIRTEASNRPKFTPGSVFRDLVKNCDVDQAESKR